MEQLVLPVRKGGLGNQMFQVAASLIYAKETGRQVLLPLEFYNSHRSIHEDYAETLFKAISHRIERPIDGYAIEMLKRNGFTQYPGEPGFDAWFPRADIPGNILLHGYFQSYPPIAKYESFIRNFYLEALKPYAIAPSKQRVGIHVRRGDYLKPPYNEVHIINDEAYYKKAVAYFNPSYTNEYWIFSDDIEWCKTQDIFQTLPNRTFIEEPNEILALAKMTTCHGGFVCAASTFSWWGAFLGAYSQRSPCIVPQPWMRGMNTDLLFPSEWIRLET